MAIFFSGYMYETGFGLKRDRNKARKLYAIAAKQRNSFAGQAMSSFK